MITGMCLYERFQRIQQRLREGQQACDLLFYCALQSLKHSFEVAFESKQGISDLEKLCQEFEESDRKKQAKAAKKREKKKLKKKENSKPLDIIKKLENKSCKMKIVNEPNLLKLASLMENEDDFEDDESEDEKTQEEIQQYLREVSEQREELRRNLRKRFAQLCVNGL